MEFSVEQLRGALAARTQVHTPPAPANPAFDEVLVELRSMRQLLSAIRKRPTPNPGAPT